MRRLVLGALIGAALVVAAAATWDSTGSAAFAQRAPSQPPMGTEAGMIALTTPSADNATLVTLVDPRQRAMAVYRVDSLSGKIKLLSVRNVQWDLQMLHLNSESPLPPEIRSLLEAR
jgi:hypothetical protein